MEDVEPFSPLKEIRGSKRLLSNIVLFDKIDAGFSEYNWRKLIHAGLVPTSPLMHRYKFDESTDAIASKHSTENELLKKCRELTFNVMRLNKTKIMRRIFSDEREEAAGIDWIAEILDKMDEKHQAAMFDILLQSIFETGEFTEGSHKISDNIISRMFLINMVGFKISSSYDAYVDALFFSTKYNGSLYSSFVPKADPKRGPLNIVDECLYVVKTQFGDGVKVLPTPRTLEEAIEMRASPSILRLKEVISKWSKKIDAGNQAPEELIEKDISKAVTSIKRLRHYQKFKESPLVFFTMSAGHHIPIIGNVVTVIEMVGWLYERWTKKRASWVQSGG